MSHKKFIKCLQVNLDFLEGGGGGDKSNIFSTQ